MKLGGAVAVLSSLESQAAAAPLANGEAAIQRAAEAEATNQKRTLVDWVNPLQGTDSTSLFSRGNTLPIVAVPFAMAHWVLQSSNDSPWFFQPHDQRLQGIRCTHQLSPWLGDYGQATFLPFCGDAHSDPSGRASSYRREELHIAPHALKMRLTRYRCDLELAPTERCSAMRFSYEDASSTGVFVDMPGVDAEINCDLATGRISALTRANSGGVPKGFACYYTLRADAPIVHYEVQNHNDRKVAIVRFGTLTGNAVNLRVGTSFISFEQAERNLQSEVGSKTLEQVTIEAAASWEGSLGRVRIQGASERQRTIFYSALYRALLFPRIWHERDAAGNTVHYRAFSGTVEAGVMYADHGYWDNYRAWYPMMALLFPERLSEILQGWINAYKEGGWMPQFPCPGYRGAMTGSLIDSVFAEAIAKGVKGFDVDAAYRGIKRHATEAAKPGTGYGRNSIAEYLRLGYIPAERTLGSVTETLDAAYGDFCIAQVARATGHTDEAAVFEKRSQNWRTLFDAKTRYLRGKQAEGLWVEPFNPILWGGPYTEGSASQYRFSVPHDPAGLIEAMGGKEPFVTALEEMLTQPANFDVGSYGQEIHEMSEMAAAHFGQYAHSNQPVHHALYMFSAAGRRDRTQYWAHRVMQELYTPETYAGDEDTGSMAAWYVLSSLGIFALCPGKPEWMLGAPLFEQVQIRYPDGREIRIEAHGKRGAFLQRVVLNGVEVRGDAIPHSELAKGGKLEFFAV